jgi:HPt (histidine-containing phosphotransfer) domain-containing protein
VSTLHFRRISRGRAGTFPAHSARVTAGPCAALLERVGGDAQIFVELCDAFLDDAPLRLGAIRAALARADVRTVAREAHAFKGAAAAFDAADLVAVVGDLERAAASGDLASARQLSALVDRHAGALIDAVRTGKDG